MGFTAEYVERITPNEREIFKSLYKDEMREKEKQQGDGNGQSISSPIDTT